MVTRSEILIRGMVQGVGFRPCVYSPANRRALRGRVRNNTTGVFIDVEGMHEDIEGFIVDLKTNAPPLSHIESVECNHDLTPADYSDFVILESAHEGEQFVLISPDVGTCDDCLRELFDPHDRRHQYPFINCTNCGPRFTIIKDIPYDRARTTMADFEMCGYCRDEYDDPLNRRFHAEPIACAACGPQLSLSEVMSAPLAVAAGDDVIPRVREMLRDGKVIAIKGIGGFHLACDALNQTAVERLRSRKYREDKPFAMMAPSTEIIKEHCAVSPREEQVLLAEQRPIVLLKKKSNSQIATGVAPGGTHFGFMLPYSPLHYLLLKNLDHPLVMTSGNISDEPICYDDEEADTRLRGIADYFLLHDRRIHMRTDDSVVRVFQNREMIVRRSRGYAPAPVRTEFRFAKQVLACGAELKNTFCIGRDNHAFVSHHIGDLENLETLSSYRDGIEHFKRLFHLRPEIVAYDLHPEYLSTKYALSLDEPLTKIAVQHHHAHIASCMADNQIDGEVIGVAMDGLGFGTDGRMWGGEFFVANFVEAERIAHLAYTPMPGGAKAIREPWRMAAVYLQQAFGDQFVDLNLPFVKNSELRNWPTIRSMVATKTNSPLTSSMGRLFDAVSSLLGVRTVVNYEGQAAIELEAIADFDCGGAYEFQIKNDTIDAAGVIRSAVTDLLNNVRPALVSGRFHRAVANLIVSVAVQVRDERRLNRVALSGGVFQNMFLLSEVCTLLRERDFEVYTHSRVPTNDGGISLGQAAVANARIQSGRI